MDALEVWGFGRVSGLLKDDCHAVKQAHGGVKSPAEEMGVLYMGAQGRVSELVLHARYFTTYSHGLSSGCRLQQTTAPFAVPLT